MFQIFDKVKCIDANFLEEANKRHSKLPKLNEIYTVRAIRLDRNYNKIGVHLMEIEGIARPDIKTEQGFKIERFEKIWMGHE